AAQSRHAAGPGQAASHIRPPFPEIPLQVNVRKDAALLSSQSGKQQRADTLPPISSPTWRSGCTGSGFGTATLSSRMG
ncbi:MAG: hypothetical protein OXC11_08470, partial [Rhodospirillales bacterium]|nr:hypothetical protein [Rhodospirillales bacterium]